MLQQRGWAQCLPHVLDTVHQPLSIQSSFEASMKSLCDGTPLVLSVLQHFDRSKGQCSWRQLSCCHVKMCNEAICILHSVMRQITAGMSVVNSLQAPSTELCTSAHIVDSEHMKGRAPVVWLLG